MIQPAPLTVRQYQEIQQEFIAYMQPFVRMRMLIENYGYRGCILHPDGTMERKYSPEAKRQLTELERQIEDAKALFMARLERRPA